MNQENPSAAAAYFHIATLSDPNGAIAAGEYGAALFAKGDIGPAEEQSRRALQLDPKYVDARYILASVEANDEQRPDAVSDFQQVLNANPDHKNAKERLGEVYFVWAEQLAKSGDGEHPVQRYRGALALRANDADLHGRLGAQLAELGRFSEAKAEFENVLKIDPTSRDAKDALSSIDVRQRLSRK